MELQFCSDKDDTDLVSSEDVPLLHRSTAESPLSSNCLPLLPIAGNGCSLWKPVCGPGIAPVDNLPIANPWVDERELGRPFPLLLGGPPLDDGKGGSEGGKTTLVLNIVAEGGCFVSLPAKRNDLHTHTHMTLA